MYTFTTNNKHQRCDPILAATPVLIMYIVHDLLGLDAYTSCTVDEQDSRVARHKRTNYMQAIACVLYSYTACNMIHAYLTHVQLVSIS